MKPSATKLAPSKRFNLTSYSIYMIAAAARRKPTRPSSRRTEAYSFWTISFSMPSSGSFSNNLIPAEPRPVPIRRFLGLSFQISRASRVSWDRKAEDSST